MQTLISQAQPAHLFLLLFAPVCVAQSTGPIDLPEKVIAFEGSLGEFSKDVEISEPTDGIRLVTVRLTADKPAELNPLTLKFDFASVDIDGYWNSQQSLDKVNYYRSGFASRASGTAPLLSYYSHRLENRLTVAASDALNPLVFSCQLKEEDVKFYGSIRMFTEKMPPTTSYEITFRFDTRPIAYYEAIDAVRVWWEKMPNMTPARVPDVARRPMYSTWYSYHQNLDADQLVRECRLARELGCYAVILDDGWQTNDSNRGYAYTGDWRPERLTNMKDFVDRIHAEDMKVVLWYSLPFMGEKAENFERFEGKYLHHWKGAKAYVLDPRYPEVRKYMIDTYEKALTEWNLDGFKLDFIGWFKTYGDTQLTSEDGRDFASVAAATDHLMTEISTRLQKLRPDVMLEFRQPYVGPVMRKYGNMFRGVDCPNNASANRNEIANLRLLSGDTAVHSDMFIWRNEESTASAARQILNVMFSVPQLSVRLEEISPGHRDMVRFWLKYWNANREVLLDGEFRPGNPGANYPSLTAVDDEKQITALYETCLACQQDHTIKELDVLNVTKEDSLVVELSNDWKSCNLQIVDAVGKVIQSSTEDLTTGVHRFEVPFSGKLTLTRE